MKKITSKLLILTICLLSFTSITSTTSANTTSEPYKQKGCVVIDDIRNCWEYAITSEVWTRTVSGKKTAEAVARVSSTGVINPGYAGGQARLYTSTGFLVNSSDWTYYDRKIASFYVYSPATSTAGNYYAQNKISIYNGDGYTQYTGYQSPMQGINLNSLLSKSPDNLQFDMELQQEYNINSDGETYGSALSEYTIGYEPDLIAAIGTDGVEGYIKNEDLNPIFNSIDEAIEYNGRVGNARVSPSMIKMVSLYLVNSNL